MLNPDALGKNRTANNLLPKLGAPALENLINPKCTNPQCSSTAYVRAGLGESYTRVFMCDACNSVWDSAGQPTTAEEVLRRSMLSAKKIAEDIDVPASMRLRARELMSAAQNLESIVTKTDVDMVIIHIEQILASIERLKGKMASRTAKKCGKCGSYDIDIAPFDSGYEFQCQECGKMIQKVKKAGVMDESVLVAHDSDEEAMDIASEAAGGKVPLTAIQDGIDPFTGKPLWRVFFASKTDSMVRESRRSDWSLAEKDALINEDGIAANAHKLDLRFTHYENNTNEDPAMNLWELYL